MSNSVSVTIKPQDARCQFWAKIIRKEQELPLPSDVRGANDVSSSYLRKGDEELLPGDCMITGEAMHHRKMRGWTYHVYFVNDSGELVHVANPGTDEKTAMKAAGMSAELLKGSGEVAACIRLLHGLRAGLI